MPAYMAQKSVTAFTDQGSKPVEVDPSWTALPGAAPSNLLKGGPGVVQPRTERDVIAAKNDELLHLAAQEARASAQAHAVRGACMLTCVVFVCCESTHRPARTQLLGSSDCVFCVL